MIRLILGTALAAAAPFAQADSEVAGGQTIICKGTRPSVTGPADRFTGHVRVDPLFAADEEIPASAAYVTFEPGARSAWHVHPAGQRLVVVAGAGLTQQWGKPVQEIHPGDVVVCPAGVKHWHGAAPDSPMTHLAMGGVSEGKTVQWMEAVTDDQYHAR